MSTLPYHNPDIPSNPGSYTYPQFVIDERTGRIEVNFIDGASGRIIRHIPSSELGEIIRNQTSTWRIRPRKHNRLSSNSDAVQ
ncbi:MAG: flagellar protein FlaG [Chloroflexota bacterium]